MDQLVADLEEKLTAARAGGGAKAAERMRSKGKMLPRERCATASCLSPYPPSQQPADDRVRARPLRLALLLDPHSPFLELSPLAAHDVYPGESVPGAGLVTGIGRISGRECVVVVNDATVKGGSYYPLTVSVPFTPTVSFALTHVRNAGG
jgi:3-methylcrotonyl-CoA carboxylase beta subunit